MLVDFFKKNIKFGFLSLGFMWAFFIGIQDVKADFATCGITATDPQFQVKTSLGDVLFAVDNVGNLDIVTDNINWSTPTGSFSDAFIIRNTSFVDIFVFNEGISYIPGDIYEGSDQTTLDNIGGNDFVVKNISDIIVARFDASTGDIYIAGSVCGLEIQINSCEELQLIGNDVNYPVDGSYILANDIDCSMTNPSDGAWDSGGPWADGYGFDPIGFSGNFNGNNFIISDLYIDRSSDLNVGLFSAIYEADIENFYLENIFVNGNSQVGGLAGSNNGSLVSDSGSKGLVNGSGRVGGLIGVSSNGGDIVNSYFDGYVMGEGNTGGLVGWINSSEIYNSYSAGTVEGGAITTGGLVGSSRNATIYNSYSTSNVIGQYYVGGLVGENYSSSIIESYASGEIIGDSIGGLVGNNTGTITNSYWNTETSALSDGCGVGTCTGVTGKTIAEMINDIDPSNETATFSAWDFLPSPSDADWKLDNVTTNSSIFPCLSWQDNDTCPVAPVMINSCLELQMIGRSTSENLAFCGDDCDKDSYPSTGSYIIAEDIDCSMTNPDDDEFDSAGIWGDGFGFMPLVLSGELDGNNKTISDLYISYDSTDNKYSSPAGLFSSISGALVANLGLLNIDIAAEGNAGGIAASSNSSTIKNSFVTGVIKSGNNYSSGGLIGSVSVSSSIENSYVVADVVGGSYAGGLIGSTYVTDIAITDSYYAGILSARNVNNRGGLIGRNSATIDNSYWNEEISDETSACGATCSNAIGTTTLAMTEESTYLDWTFDPTEDAVWKIVDSATENYYPCFSWQEDETCPTAPIVINSCEELQMIGHLVEYDSLCNEDICDFKASTGYPLDGNYVLVDDLNCSATKDGGSIWDNALFSGEGFDPIGSILEPFTGEFFGNYIYINYDSYSSYYNREILGLYIDKSAEDYVGLFRSAQGAEIANLKLLDSEINGNNYVGSLIGVNQNNSIVRNIYNKFNFGEDGGVNANNYVGSLVGLNDNALISDSKAIIDIDSGVNGYNYIGGLVGYNTNNGIILNSVLSTATYHKNIGSVLGEDYVGGITGYNNNAVVEGCETGSVKQFALEGDEYIGGLVGYNDNGEIILSISGLPVSGNNNVGGLVGYNIDSIIEKSYASANVTGISKVGGLIGSNNAELSYSYAGGNITGTSYVGGLIGENNIGSSLTHVYANGDVTGDNYVGGLIGSNNSSVTNSYSTGRIVGNTYTGGLVGYSSSAISDSYWNEETSNQASACGYGDCSDVEGKIIDAMRGGQDPSSQLGFDWVFDKSDDTEWKLDEIEDNIFYYPCLSWQNDTTCPFALIAIDSCKELQMIGHSELFDMCDDTECDFKPTGYPLDGDYGLYKSVDCEEINPLHYRFEEDGIWADGKGFKPIGSTTEPFIGRFYGIDNNIRSMFIDRETEDNIGIFGVISGGKIIDLIITYSDITGNDNVGGLVGEGNSSFLISGSSLTYSDITGNDNVGGLVGSLDSSSMLESDSSYNDIIGNENVGGVVGLNDNSSSVLSSRSGAWTGSIDGNINVGGLVGKSDNFSSIESSSSWGVISGNDNIGGLVGYNDGNSSIISSYLRGNLVQGKVDGNNNVGGLVGVNNNSSIIYSSNWDRTNVNGSNYVGGLVGMVLGNSIIEKSFALGDVSGDTSNVGGLIGLNSSSSVIDETYSVSKVEGFGVNMGGLVGSNLGTITDSYWNTETSGQTIGCGSGDCSSVGAKTIDEMRGGQSPSNELAFNWTFDASDEEAWKLDDIDNSSNYYPCPSSFYNNACPDALIKIDSCTELQMIDSYEFSVSQCGDDCDYDSYPNGGNYLLVDDIDCSITNPTDADFDSEGLWGDGKGFDPILQSRRFQGVFEGDGHVINDLYISRDSENYVGLFGNLSTAEINNLGLVNVYVSGGYNHVGGLVGFMSSYSNFENINVTGDVIGTGSQVGGLLGYNNVNYNIDNVHFSGDVSGTGSYIGGLFGWSPYAAIENSSFIGAVNGGGNYVGGIVGYGKYLINSYANSTVSGINYVGGLAGGYGVSVITSYAISNVEGESNVGGLVGRNSTEIIDSYSASTISGISNVGALVGENSPTISNAYWNTDLTSESACGNSTCSDAVGISTTQMIDQDTYSAWDFTSIWDIDDDVTYPCHLWWVNKGNTCQAP